MDENKVTLNAEEARRILQEKQQADIVACQNELLAVLDKYQMTLQVVQIIVDGQSQTPQIRVVPKDT